MKKSRATAAALLAALLTPFSAPAQTYPVRQITIVVAFPAGAAQDIAARVIAKKLNEQFGRPVIVENRPGAAGTVGSALVARAAPDGYTLLLGALGAMVVTPLAKKNVGYDPARDFTPIALLTSQPMILLVSETGPYKTFAELVAAGKQPGAKLNYASAGIGSLSNFASEQFNAALGTGFLHVPYQGSAPALRALIGGEVAMYFAAATDAVPRLKQSARGLLVSLPRRWPSAPDVPSLTDLGLQEPNMDMWYGLLGPAGVPKDIVAKLNDAVQAALKDPAVQQSVPGSEVTFGTPESFAAMLNADLARVAKQIALTGFKAE